MPRFYYSRESESIPGGIGAFHNLLMRMSRGDVLVVPSVDHLASNIRNLRLILDALAYKGILLSPQFTLRKPGETVEQGFCHDIKRAGVERAKARGSYTTGCPKKASLEIVRELADAGADAATIAAMLGISVRTVFRYLQ